MQKPLHTLACTLASPALLLPQATKRRASPRRAQLRRRLRRFGPSRPGRGGQGGVRVFGRQGLYIGRCGTSRGYWWVSRIGFLLFQGCIGCAWSKGSHILEPLKEVGTTLRDHVTTQRLGFIPCIGCTGFRRPSAPGFRDPWVDQVRGA